MLGRLMLAVERILALAFIFAVCLNFANVVGRYVFGYSISGADEIQIYIMVWMAFLGAAVVAWRREHLRMDVLVKMLPSKGQRILEMAVRENLSLASLWRDFARIASTRQILPGVGRPRSLSRPPHPTELRAHSTQRRWIEWTTHIAIIQFGL